MTTEIEVDDSETVEDVLETLEDIVEEQQETLEDIVEELTDTIEEIVEELVTDETPAFDANAALATIYERFQQMESRLASIETRDIIEEIVETLTPEPEPIAEEVIEPAPDVAPKSRKSKFHGWWFGS